MPILKIKGLPWTKSSGIYVITNVVNGKVYIGSAMCIRGRLLYHRSFLRRGKHDNQILQRAWVKFGELAFRFDVLEFCDPSVLIEREQHWIDSHKASNRMYGYNICPAAGSAMLGRKHSAETVRKMSERLKGVIPYAATEAAAKVNRGKKRPKDVCERIGAARRGKPRTESERENIRNNHWTLGPNADEIRRTISEKKQLKAQLKKLQQSEGQ